jgi:predicted SAM-dependent methyltransferase
MTLISRYRTLPSSLPEPVRRVIRSSQQRVLIARSLTQRGQRIQEYIASHDVRKLQIGTCFNPLAGWLNTDIQIQDPCVVYLNALHEFPIPSGTFDYVYSEHVIEHLPFEGGLSMLKESFRVLRPGGRIRVATPSLDAFVRLFDGVDAEGRQFIDFMSQTCLPGLPVRSAALVMNNTFRAWGHLFIYDAYTLSEALKVAGFVDVKVYGYGESNDLNLNGLETHGRDNGASGQAAGRYETMAVEGAHP